MINYVAAKGTLVSANDVAPYLQLSDAANRYTNGGPCVGLLEERLRGLLEIDDDRAVVATCSGTAALYATIGALWLVRGCFPVAVQAFTFPCAVQQLLSGSCVVDVDPGGGLDLSQVPDHVGGIVVTNSFGHLLDLDRYEAWQRETGKVLVLDNASTPATYWRGRNSLNMGDAAVVSLHHTKPLGFGEGGFLVIDRRYEQAARSCINFGFESGVDDGPPVALASNFKMSEIAAAYHLTHLDHFEEICSHQRRLHASFSRAIDEIPHLDLFPNHGDPTLSSCLPVLFEHCVDTRPFSEQGIVAQKYYRPLRNAPRAQDLYERTICLPLHLDVTESEIVRYVALCQDVGSSRKSDPDAASAHGANRDHLGESLQRIRDRIDQIDDALLRLLSNRLTAAREISELKFVLGIEPCCPEREREVRERWVGGAAKSGVDPDSWDCIVEAILTSSRSLQNGDR